MQYRDVEITTDVDGGCLFHVANFDYLPDDIEGARDIINEVLDQCFTFRGVEVYPTDPIQTEPLAFEVAGIKFVIANEDADGKRNVAALRIAVHDSDR